MIIPKEIKQNYDFLKPHFLKVKDIIDQTLLNYSNNKHFAYSSRVKELDSLSEKIESGRYKDWNSIDDFIGAVIIIPNINYETEILEFLEATFNKFDLKLRGSTLKNPDVFRFDATRFIGKLRSVGDEKIINTVNFEVQIRSAFEHAWSVTTHDLAYKSNSIDWKILRLAAQLKASVEQLDMISLSANEIKNNIHAHQWPETDIKMGICEFFDHCFSDNLIPNELIPKDMSRFSENLFNVMRNSPDLMIRDKSKNELSRLMGLIKEQLISFSLKNFPMSLSLFQICYGALLNGGVISEDVSKKLPFYKSDLFETVFPVSKNMKIKQFIINKIEVE